MDESFIQELIKGCRKKDRGSQKRLYQEFYSHAMRMCVRYAEDKEVAVDLVNNGFLKVFTTINRYESAKPFKSWLGSIMIHTSIDHYRKQIKLMEKEALNGKHDMEDKENILTHVHYEDLIKLVQKLSVAYRTVFNLFAIDGYSHEEIADMLCISVRTSESNLFQAREQLKNMLKSR